MDIRFEDHSHFQRTAGLAALGGAAMVALAPELAIAGSALAVALWPGDRRRKAVVAIACTITSALAIANHWPWALSGALLGLLLVLARMDAVKESGSLAPPISARIGAVLLCAATAW